MTKDHGWIVLWTYGESKAKAIKLVQTKPEPDDIDAWMVRPRYRTYPIECEIR